MPTPEVRGEHAHNLCHQFLICIGHPCRVLLNYGHYRREVTHDRSKVGVYVASISGTQYDYSPDAVLLVFEWEYYNPDKYIRNYGEVRTFGTQERLV